MPKYQTTEAHGHTHIVDVNDDGHGISDYVEDSVFIGEPTLFGKVDTSHCHGVGAWQVSEVLDHTHTIRKTKQVYDE